MKVAHIYDHTYYKCDEKYFSKGAFGRTVWCRYLEHFEKVTVVANFGGSIISSENFNESSSDNVDFVFVENQRKPSTYLRSLMLGLAELEDIIVSHDAVIIRLPSELGYIAQRYCRDRKVPYAIEAVGCPWDAYWNYGNIQGKLLAPISMHRMKKAIWESKFTLYVTAKFLQDRYPTKGYSRNASNVIIPDCKGAILNSKIALLKHDKDFMKIGLIGSLDVRYKGHEELLRAFHLIKEEFPDFRLYFVGSGKSNRVLELTANLGLRDKVEVIGQLEGGDQIFQFLDDLDLYVHPSKQEGLPRSVIEAMSRACPVLASSVGGIPELLDPQYMHQPGDFKELARQLRTFLSDKKSLTNMATINFWTAKNYNSDILSQKRHEFFSAFKKSIT